MDAHSVRGVIGRAQTAGHRLIIAMWEFVTSQDGVAFIVGPRGTPSLQHGVVGSPSEHCG